MTEKLKFHLSTTCNSRPQKFPSVLPIVFKADFIRKNNALSRGVNLYPQRHVPVVDFTPRKLSSREIA